MKVYYNEIEPSAILWLQAAMAEGAISKGVIDTRSIEDVRPDELIGYDRCHFFAGIGGWEIAIKIAESRGWKQQGTLWTGSCPCFVAGTRILTSGGYVPIENVKVGDRVLTHRNLWQKVTHIGTEYSEIVEVKGQGHWGINTTPNHPFYCDNDEWVHAENLLGRRWRSPLLTGRWFLPRFDRKGVLWEKGAWKATGSKDNKTVYLGRFNDKKEAEFARSQAAKEGLICTRGAELAEEGSLQFAEFLGYWLGDGWVTGNRIVVCGGDSKIQYMREMLGAANLPHTCASEKTVHKRYFQDKYLAEWLTEHFGNGADSKKNTTMAYLSKC